MSAMEARMGTEAYHAWQAKLSAKARGEGNSRARLTWNDVRVIRASTEAYGILAARLGVDRTTIGLVKRNKTWVEQP